MEELKKLIERLNNKSNESEQIQQVLQRIGAELLTKYEIRVKNIIIEPLRVEPYLFIPTIFEDKFIHSENGIYGLHQRNRFGKLYIHKGFSGVDIVLSDSDEYAFSFLIKNSRILIDNKVAFPFVKQDGVAKILKEHGIPNDYDDSALCKKELPNNNIEINGFIKEMVCQFAKLKFAQLFDKQIRNKCPNIVQANQRIAEMQDYIYYTMELTLTNEILASINPHNLSNETIVQDILKKGFELMELYYGDSYENLD